jgi:SfnB family sulfur acquisition oxidoreductase
MDDFADAPIDYTHHPRVNSNDPVPPRPRPKTPANVIKTDEEATNIARKLAAEFRVGAALRDREGLLPLAELDAYSQSGLWGINVPKAYGGPGVSYATLADVIKIIASGDPNLAQITQNHLAIIAHIDADGTDELKHHLFGLVLSGIRFGNAFSEKHTANAGIFSTQFAADGDEVIVNGKKFYTTGALLSHIVPIAAVDENNNAHLVFADRAAPGLTITNDWSSFGQRTTGSGTATFQNVRVPRKLVLPAYRAFERPTAAGPISQIIQAAIDLGIATGALEDTIAFVRTKSRPWIDSGKETAGEDLFTIAAIGDLEIKIHAAEALLEIAGKAIDKAVAEPSEANVTEATIKTGESKVLTTEAAILSTNKLFELAGARATLAEHALDRHWRNARTHTLHDPVRWKYFHIGNYYLNDIHPPRHPWN